MVHMMQIKVQGLEKLLEIFSTGFLFTQEKIILRNKNGRYTNKTKKIKS